MQNDWAKKNTAAGGFITFCLVACAGGSNPAGSPSFADSAVGGSANAGGLGNAAEGGMEVNQAAAGNEGARDGASPVSVETGSPSRGQRQGQADASSVDGAVQSCGAGAGAQAALSSGLPAACETCLCAACPKEFGPPTGMDDPAIAGDVEAGFELPGGSNAQGCDTNCWLFWSCMYMNGCAELNAFDVSGITNCLTSHCASQYAAIGAKWPNDSDLCSVRNAKGGEQRACASQCSGD
jgi:hypothetical protein